MSSIKNLKKDINNTIGSLIEDIYHWELSNPKADLKQSEGLIDEAIAIFDRFIAKINAVEKKEAKSQFRSLHQELEETIKTLEAKVAAL